MANTILFSITLQCGPDGVVVQARSAAGARFPQELDATAAVEWRPQESFEERLKYAMTWTEETYRRAVGERGFDASRLTIVARVGANVEVPTLVGGAS